MEDFFQSKRLKFLFLLLSVVFIFSIAVLDGQHEIGQVIACGLVAGSSLLCFVKLLIYENDKK
ncbi:MAG: hypothetical protein CL824_03045 [Crocinitomicaceae bacterium]|nr:hypothetical protein [Crocinitomicaceae bacterium]|tara:strand:+ start:256 stop:444 length:189 start_codon:yes stop_codon:yes gene_type:complete